MYFEMLYCYANCIKTRISVSTSTCSFKMISKCTNQDKVWISKTYHYINVKYHMYTLSSNQHLRLIMVYVVKIEDKKDS